MKKIKAYHDLERWSITVEHVSRVIKEIVREKQRPTAELIINEVCRFYSIDSAVLRGTQKNKTTAEARQVAMYLIRKLAEMSYPDIGKEFGKNHTTVMYACNRIEQELSNSGSGMQDNLRDISANIDARL